MSILLQVTDIENRADIFLHEGDLPSPELERVPDPAPASAPAPTSDSTTRILINGPNLGQAVLLAKELQVNTVHNTATQIDTYI